MRKRKERKTKISISFPRSLAEQLKSAVPEAMRDSRTTHQLIWVVHEWMHGRGSEAAIVAKGSGNELVA